MGATTRSISSHNTLRSERTAGAWFLRVATERLPADTEVVAVNNLTVGLGLFTLAAPGRFEANFPVLESVLGDTQTLDFRLGAGTLLKGAGVTPPVVDGQSLAPTAEFTLPVGTTPLARSRCVDARRVPIARRATVSCAPERRERQTRSCS